MPKSRSISLPQALVFIATLAVALSAVADELSDVQRLYYSGQPENAMQRVDKYLLVNPKDPQMRFLKGVMLSDSKREVEAIAVFQKLTEDYPDLAEPYNNLAALYASSGDYAKARATLQQALRTNPEYATAHENLGDVYAALAAQSYQRAIKLDPTNLTAAPKLTLVRELYKRSGAASPSGLPAASAAGLPAASAASAATPSK